jgi:hypothetical protein
MILLEILASETPENHLFISGHPEIRTDLIEFRENRIGISLDDEIY